ncbi:hypothetical protein P389DRAFT_152182 [Cystobasidium minutum MCA 4210]|uniref:mitochondrial 54S ribosomal protein bL34m n=1 Tax=Cystobasidium minutum MCA 4210 TaxID=1397322 RepID=UPI0034CF5229|eukprot:jgi/Rhomi1/152182/estExt_Genewise1.C_4_t10081
MPRILRATATARSLARCSAPSSSSGLLRACHLQRIEPEAGPSSLAKTPTTHPKLASILRGGESSTSSVLRSRLPFSSTLQSSNSSILLSRFPSLSLLSASPIPSASSSIAGQTQVRTVTYGSEYQPSQRVRKRRHGFLARRRSKGGRKVLIRRRMKGRRFLSH